MSAEPLHTPTEFVGYLHLYAQWQWHMDAGIVGDREGLRELRDAIDAAITNGSSILQTFTDDGEGYELIIAVAEPDEIGKLTAPYADNITSGEGISYWTLAEKREAERLARTASSATKEA